jgi:hypothetical protein
MVESFDESKIHIIKPMVHQVDCDEEPLHK